MQNQGIRDARSLGTPKLLDSGPPAHVRHVRRDGARARADWSFRFRDAAVRRFGHAVLPFRHEGQGSGLPGQLVRVIWPAMPPSRRTAKPRFSPTPASASPASGLLYLILAALVRGFGANRVMRFFPPVVTGPIIICIGMTLANSAINNCTGSWDIALVAILTVVIFNIWGKGMLRIIPILLGVLVSYVYAAVTGRVDFSGVASAAWIGLPVKMENTVFSLIGNCDANLLVTAIIAIMPIAFATMIEHIGDICAISSTVGANFIADPGLHRTLLGDGLATSIASLFGAPANTTYGENTGVLALTRVYDPLVIRLAAVYAIIASFCPKFAALVSAMPTGTIGGVSLILYGMISAIGVRNLVENRVDLAKSRNVIVVSLIISLALGITFSAAGAITFHVGEFTLNFSGLARRRHRRHCGQRHPSGQGLQLPERLRIRQDDRGSRSDAVSPANANQSLASNANQTLVFSVFIQQMSKSEILHKFQ